jgi:hypothetical protein
MAAFTNLDVSVHILLVLPSFQWISRPHSFLAQTIAHPLFCPASRAKVGAFAAECEQAGRFQSGRQIRKRRTSMKKQTLIFASFCWVVGLAMVPAQAQSWNVQAKIPFNFTVLEKTFPAGDYRMIAKPHQVKIEDAQGKIVAMVLANDVSGRSGGENGGIIFHCYRDRCFLALVLSPTQGKGRELLTSRAETNLAKEDKEKYFAILGERTQKRH